MRLWGPLRLCKHALSCSQGAGLVAQALAVHAGKIIHEAVKADLRNDSTHHLVVVELCPCGDLTSHHDHVVLKAL